MAKASKFVYKGRERSVEDVTRRSRQSSGSYDNVLITDIARLKVKEGECTFRILPPTWEDIEKYGDSWEIGLWVHYKVGPDEGQFLCLDKMKGEPCPICEARREASDEEERDALKPSWRAICWAIDRDNEKAGPQVWEISATLFRDINARSIDKKTNAVICIDAPEEGYDVTFNREGTTKLNTKYTAMEVSRDSTPIHENEKLQDRWITYIQEHPLPEILNFQDADYIEKVLSGKVSKKKDAEDEEDEDPPPRRSSRRRDEEEETEAPLPRSRRHGVEVEEEDPTGDPEPTTRSSRKRTTTEPEEEEAEADVKSSTRRREADIDDDPPPRKSRRAEPEENAEELPEESRTARKSLERLRPGARKSVAEAEEEDDPPPRRRR